MPGMSYDLYHDWRLEMHVLTTPQGTFRGNPIKPDAARGGDVVVVREVAYHLHETLPVLGFEGVYAGAVASVKGDLTYARMVLLLKESDLIHRVSNV